jgi:type IV pilus assembly protein PilN
MARINLLPWREELRRERQKQFMMSLLATAVIAVVIVFAVGMFFDQKISNQQFRNDRLRTEIKSLEVRIKRIDQLEATKARLISRKQVIETLQASRSMTVELLDNLAKSIPVGVTLTSIKQQDMTLTLIGTSQSNARVSAYLQELEQNELFLNPQLDFVKSVANPVRTTESYQFSIKVTLRPPISEEEMYDGVDGEIAADLAGQGGSQ